MLGCKSDDKYIDSFIHAATARLTTYADDPFGGGRVVSLFAHKKYDNLSLEYVDAAEGIHGAIFQLTKGQGELLKNELIAQGATISSRQDHSTKQSATEARHENK